MATTLQMMGDRVLVRPVQEDEVRESGLVIPDMAKERPQRGDVVAVGPGARGRDGQPVPLEVEEDDEVLFARYGGTEIKVAGEDMLVLREADILAVT